MKGVAIVLLAVGFGYCCGFQAGWRAGLEHKRTRRGVSAVAQVKHLDAYRDTGRPA